MFKNFFAFITIALYSVEGVNLDSKDDVCNLSASPSSINIPMFPKECPPGIDRGYCRVYNEVFHKYVFGSKSKENTTLINSQELNKMAKEVFLMKMGENNMYDQFQICNYKNIYYPKNVREYCYPSYNYIALSLEFTGKLIDNDIFYSRLGCPLGNHDDRSFGVYIDHVFTSYQKYKLFLIYLTK